MKRYIVTILLLVVVVALVVIYLLFDPSQWEFFPRCPFLVLTGLKCPGCGSQRVVHSLLQGDIASAWHYNAFMVAMLPVVLLYSYAEIVRTRKPALYDKLNSQIPIWTIFTLVILWWVVRNIFGW